MGKNKYYCKIDGVVHNLSDVQEVLDGKSERNIILIMYEEHGMDIVSANTFESVLRFHNNEIPSDYNEALRRWQEYNQASLSRCPRCGSTNIKYNLEFASWMAAQGQEPVSDSVLKDNKCGNCGFKW
ncbi:hypothetical protein [[Clostridium] hylemonae]|uniref:Uncharacterized protein n=1 Tax=[Clostridium] hylemonae DSM 15053 TaxID=553973 RepID=C0BX94_9FIRM|nr:hypothetical protein [[Clostridium] hylemonae]EEG75456.1 hypothetical protein CLOHYLEM_04431 [[Clostridium] hylemonae DSM 15053]QEK18038.1 hypothetical protein LAJLEIBI_02053 [[Clostridium] hylemonae DSM 15053]